MRWIVAERAGILQFKKRREVRAGTPAFRSSELEKRVRAGTPAFRSSELGKRVRAGTPAFPKSVPEKRSKYWLGSHLPAADVFELLCRQRIDSNAECTQLQTGNLGVNLLGQKMHSRIQLTFVFNEVFH